MNKPAKKKAYLLLEDGFKMEGTSIGKIGTSGGEICFNTGMTGYQEVYTDPSYYGQVVINTNAHIGNYGTVGEENESEAPKINGLIINDFSRYSSREGSEPLQDYLVKHQVVGIADVDTRSLVRHIRDKGAMNVIVSSELPENKLESELKKLPQMNGLELASLVSTTEPYMLGEENKIKVAVLDFGIKRSILTNFVKRGCQLKVFPAKTPYKKVMDWEPAGIFLSNGPGDPAAMDYAVETVKKIIDANQPIFGICLGHQIIARSFDISTYKMHHGHRGLNHPIKNLKTGKSEITSQNHGFSISKEDVEKSNQVKETHINLNDGTVEGIEINGKKIFSVQYHPESSPGPHDSEYLFDNFIKLITNN
ncbi:Carbamoyl-phosphate synthase small chain [hydrothermal vent metagenome]|uniref:carbamoyl-phosphate synthase (glutamine-hydrolyzing) n=1 Tax=hydrothermal vent metagenome TaxID=652676 RepID=A0A3B0UQL8_9ZZZZ